MQLKTRVHAVALGLAILAGGHLQAEPIGNAFTFQSVLSDNGTPIDGPVDLRLSLWDAAAGGTQVGTTLDQAVTADEGKVTVDLDFTTVSFAEDRALWLELEVSTDGGVIYTTVGRQRLNPTPFSLFSLNTRGLNVAADGKIGIGTDTPGYRLTIDQPGHGFSHLWDAGGGAGESDITTFVTGNGGWIGTRNPKPLYLYTNDSAPKVTLDTLGNLGIGTQSPAMRLDVRDFTLNGTALGVQQIGGGSTIGIDATVIAGAGVRGTATSGTGTNFGVIGIAPDTGWGVFSQGRIGATGTKSFVIDHPMDPANKMLLHYSSEAPEPLNTYSGTVVLDGAGHATIDLPDYFESINADYRYQLTAIGGAAPNLHVATEIAGNRFSVAGGQPGLKVSWEVTARRDDAFVRLKGSPKELLKAPENRGKFLLPEAYDAPASRAIHAVKIAPSE